MTNIHSEEVSIESVQLVVDYTELAKSLSKNKHFMKQVKNSMQFRAQNEAWELVVKELGSHYDVKKMVKDYAIVPEFRISQHVGEYLKNGKFCPSC